MGALFFLSKDVLKMDSYRTVKSPASDEYVVKRSRFIGTVRPVKTQEEANDFIREMKTKYWDATHNVSAYVLRDGNVRRYSDDNEPQGTAGMPTLDVLLKEELTDCAVVITRYFGGVLLGAGGLVRAYSHACKLAVDAGGIITMALCSVMEVTCDYNFYGKLNSLIPETGGVIEDTEFTDNVTIRFRLPSETVPAFQANLIDVSNGRFSAEVVGELYSEI